MYKKVLTHPLTVIGSIVMGALFGLLSPQLAKDCGEAGIVYLRALQMCVLPLIAAAIFNSVVSLVKTRSTSSGIIRQIVMVFSFGILSAAAAGVLFGLYFHYGNGIDSVAQMGLGKMVNNQVHGLSSGAKMSFSNAHDFLNLVIPKNPFSAFADGSGLKIVFFCIVIAISVSFGRKENVDLILRISGEVYEACLRILDFIVLFLPFGLFFIFAKQLSELSFDLMRSLGQLLIVMVVATALLTLANLLVIKFVQKKSIAQVTKGVLGVLVMAFGTSSGFATLPKIIEAMTGKFGAKKRVVTLTAPLATNMSPQGTAIAIVLFAMFFARLYSIELTAGTCLTIFFGAAMISIAISGLPAIVGASMMAGLLAAIGVPVNVATVILLAILPFVDPFLTLLNCCGICTYCVVLDKWQYREQEVQELDIDTNLASNEAC